MLSDLHPMNLIDDLNDAFRLLISIVIVSKKATRIFVVIEFNSEIMQDEWLFCIWIKMREFFVSYLGTVSIALKQG